MNSKSATTPAYGALFHWLLGSGWVPNSIAAGLAGAAGAALVDRAVLPVIAPKRLARFGCCGLALCPTFVVFSPVLGSKGVSYLVSALWGWLISKHLHARAPTAWLYRELGLALGWAHHSVHPQAPRLHGLHPP